VNSAPFICDFRTAMPWVVVVRDEKSFFESRCEEPFIGPTSAIVKKKIALMKKNYFLESSRSVHNPVQSRG